MWTVLDRQICSQDEISICKVRLQLKNEDDGDSSFSKGTVNRTLKNLSYEQKATHDFINLIMPAEVMYRHFGKFLFVVECDKFVFLIKQTTSLNFNTC